MKRPKVPTQWHPVDIVALVLAAGLSITIVLILIASSIQIIHGSFPQVKLSENATQVLIAGTGGLTGLLGAYIGLNRRSNHSNPPSDTSSEQTKPPPE